MKIWSGKGNDRQVPGVTPCLAVVCFSSAATPAWSPERLRLGSSELPEAGGKLLGSSGKHAAGAGGDTGVGGSGVAGTPLSSRTAAWQAGAGRCEAVESLPSTKGVLCRLAGRVAKRARRAEAGFHWVEATRQWAWAGSGVRGFCAFHADRWKLHARGVGALPSRRKIGPTGFSVFGWRFRCSTVRLCNL